MNTAYYKTQKAQRKKSSRVLWIVPLLAALFLAWASLFPLQSGAIGRIAARNLFFLFGKGAYLVPLLLGIFSLKNFLSRSGASHGTLKALAVFLALWFGCMELSHLSHALDAGNWGGLIGKYSFAFFHRALGSLGATLLAGAVFLLSIRLLTDVSFESVATGVQKAVGFFLAKLSEDWESWKKTRSKPVIARSRESGPVIQKPKEIFANSKVSPAPEPTRPVIVPRVVMPDPKVVSRKAQPVEAKEGTAQEASAAVPGPYQLPPTDLLSRSATLSTSPKEEELVSNAARLEKTLADFGVQAKVTDIHPGPVVTRYDLFPAAGVKVSSISGLSNDVALAMQASSVRVLAPVPGKAAVGIEIPNSSMAKVELGEIVATEEFQNSASKLSIGLGKTTEGKPCVGDLIPMPHLLIAGATGSGKSVCIHSLMVSWLYKARPDEVKFLLIDQKRLELPAYATIPHLYDPRVPPSEVKVITNSKDASKALQAMTDVMDDRYERFAKANVRDIEGFNKWAEKNSKPKEYYIVVVIDELADLMMVAPKEVEDSIQRLAQMSRAVGIHLVLATQRPSVDVITGVIKANLPSRIAFQVLSKIDSRVILDAQGAEDLLGKGDMLFLPTGAPKPVRLQGAFVSSEDIEKVVKFVSAQGKPDYAPIKTQNADEEIFADEESVKDLATALKLVSARRRVSQDLLKAHFGSSARATNLLSLLEVKGFISKPEGTNRWEIFFDRIEEFLSRSETQSEAMEETGVEP